MFGRGRIPNVREIYRDALRDDLSNYAQRYWDRRISRFFGKQRKTMYFCGTSGSFARAMNFYIDRVAKARPGSTRCSKPKRSKNSRRFTTST